MPIDHLLIFLQLCSTVCYSFAQTFLSAVIGVTEQNVFRESLLASTVTTECQNKFMMTIRPKLDMFSCLFF